MWVVWLSGALKFGFAMDCGCGVMRVMVIGVTKLDEGEAERGVFSMRWQVTCSRVCESNSKARSVTIVLSDGICGALMGSFHVDIECIASAMYSA